MVTLEELFIKKEMYLKEKIFVEAKIAVVDDLIVMEQGKVENPTDEKPCENESEVNTDGNY